MEDDKSDNALIELKIPSFLILMSSKNEEDAGECYKNYKKNY